MKENAKINLKYMFVTSITAPIVMMINWLLFDVDFTLSLKSLLSFLNVFVHQIVMYVFYVEITKKYKEIKKDEV